MKLKEYAPIILRIGISLLFLWFGLTNIFNPNYLLGYLPQYALTFGIPGTTIMIINGIFEVILGGLLLIGLFTRISSFILTIHVFGIALSLGYNDVAIRDLGLAIATLVVFLNGKDKWCLDNKLRK